MNGNEFVDYLFNLIPIIIENLINTLFPKSFQIWFANNYKLIGLIFLFVLLIGLTFVVIKDLFKRSN